MGKRNVIKRMGVSIFSQSSLLCSQELWLEDTNPILHDVSRQLFAVVGGYCRFPLNI